MRKVPHYSYRVFWSKEDGEYVAECGEIQGLSGLGPSEAEAIEELKVAIGIWLDHLKSVESALPTPRVISNARTRPAATKKRASS
jgi:predicted RNase H-like HicB family nuclease